MRMRILRLVAVLLLLAGPAVQAGQPWDKQLNRPRNENRVVRFGIGVSLNVMDFRVLNTGTTAYDASIKDSTRYVADVQRLHPGFNVNAIMRIRFTDNLHLRFLPGISFGQRDLVFYRDNELESNQSLAETSKIETSYIEMPILLCYSAKRIDNARPYFIAGLNPKLDMAAFKKLKVENNQLMRLKKFDIAYEVGFGFEFYFTYFKMAPEIKWSGGFLNALASGYAEGADGYYNAIKSLTSQAFIVSLIFE